MKNIIILIIINCFLVGCGQSNNDIDESKVLTKKRVEERYKVNSNSTDDSDLGIGVSTNGKIGMSVAPGIVLTSDGLGVGITF